MAAGRIGALAGALAFALAPASAEPFARPSPYAGAVVANRGGEELKFPTDALWRGVVPAQRLVGGDTVRTNTLGAVSILFEDRTQIRVGRNSTLIVKEIARGPNGETRLALPQGDVYARASRGGAGVVIDTPAAAAAVRGTDWSLSVDGPKTGLAVLDGEVTLANRQGSVTVRKGEGAEALIGQAPRKFTLVDYEGRVQFLLYRELRDSFFDLAPSALTVPAQRGARARLLATPEPARSAEDWLSLAELGLAYDGAAAAERALDEARRRPLHARQRARADLVDAFLEGRRANWREAARLVARAKPRLPAAQRDVAAYLGWIAETLSDPKRKPAPLPSAAIYARSPQGAFAQAVVESFTENNRRGADLLAEAARRHPGDARAPAGRAALLLSMGDDKAAAAEIERARAIDPDDPFVLLLEARYFHTVRSDLDAARNNVKRALEAAPGFALAWAELGLIEEQRNAIREAEFAHLKAIELNPKNLVIVANYATFLVNRNQVGAASRVVDEVERIDPASLPALFGRGRILLRQGEPEKALDKMLAASAVNPTYADGQVEVAIAQYRLGAMEEVAQALDNADRYDDDGPVALLVRSLIAVDQYRADEAIVAAREALKRRLARGGYYGTIESDRQNGSPINSALRFLALDDWGRYYGDRTFDPFNAVSYFDQSRASRATPFSAFQPSPIEGAAGETAVTSILQGLLLEPLAAAAPERRQQLVHSSFFETAVGGGPRFEGGSVGWTSNATVQAKSMGDVPFAVFLSADIDRPDSPIRNDKADEFEGTAYVGLQPTPYDSLILLGTRSDFASDFRAVDAFSIAPDRLKGEETTAGAGWSHTFGERNVLQVLGGASEQKQRYRGALAFGGFPFEAEAPARERSGVAAVSHLVGLGDVTLRYGLEGLASRSDGVSRLTRVADGAETTIRSEGDGRVGLAYADALWDVTSRLKIEGAAFLTASEFDETSVCAPNCLGARTEERARNVDFRIGAAFEPIRGHWLRAGYIEKTALDNVATLAPVATVGLTPTELPEADGARSRTFAARWDAEWTRHVFTALEYQSQKADELDFGIPESLTTVPAVRAKVERLEASANVWLTHGVGLFARYARTWGEARGRADLPFVADHVGRIGATLVHHSMVKLTVAETLVGPRTDGLGRRLPSYATTDASITWETFDKRLALGLFALNVFDKRYIAQTGYVAAPPFLGVADIAAQGRTVLATARVRL